MIQTFSDNSFDSVKSTSSNKKDIFGIYFDKLLIWVFSSSFWWNIYYCSFQKLQKCLLNSLSRNISSNRWIVAFSCDFVNFINKHNSSFGFFNIIIGCLQKSGKDAFNVFPDITGFC